jgi:hypothetical protein
VNLFDGGFVVLKGGEDFGLLAKEIDVGIVCCIVGKHHKVPVAFATLGGHRANNISVDELKRLLGLWGFTAMLGERSPSHLAENRSLSNAIRGTPGLQLHPFHNGPGAPDCR